MYLGPNIGFQNVMSFHDTDGSCHLDLGELGKVCQSHYQECMSFLQNAQNKTTPQCQKVYLGSNVGYQHIMTYHDSDGSCHVSMTELGKVCKSHFAECMAFLQSSKQPSKQPQCQSVFLGKDVGYAKVMEYHKTDGTCHLSMSALAKVCKSYFSQCLSFLQSSQNATKKTKPKCQDVFLGPDIGFVNVFEYHDADGTCKLSLKELQSACKQFYLQCLSFLQSSNKKKPKCEDLYLGPNIGFSHVLKYDQKDGKCHVDMTMLSTVCRLHYSECISFLNSNRAECTANSGNRAKYTIQNPGATTAQKMGKITCAPGYRAVAGYHIKGPIALCKTKGGSFTFEGCK